MVEAMGEVTASVWSTRGRSTISGGHGRGRHGASLLLTGRGPPFARGRNKPPTLLKFAFTGGEAARRGFLHRKPSPKTTPLPFPHLFSFPPVFLPIPKPTRAITCFSWASDGARPIAACFRFLIDARFLHAPIIPLTFSLPPPPLSLPPALSAPTTERRRGRG